MSAALRRLREHLVAALAIVEEQIAALDGVAAASNDSTPIIGSHLKAVKQIAPRLGMSEKTLRKIAPEIGAEVRIGGRVFVDERILAVHLQGKILPLSSISAPTQIDDHSFE